VRIKGLIYFILKNFELLGAGYVFSNEVLVKLGSKLSENQFFCDKSMYSIRQVELLDQGSQDQH
jgi:hypothetical protein